MPAPINSAHIKPREYDAILRRIRELGRTDAAYALIAAEFNRGITTIRKLGPKAA